MHYFFDKICQEYPELFDDEHILGFAKMGDPINVNDTARMNEITKVHEVPLKKAVNEQVWSDYSSGKLSRKRSETELEWQARLSRDYPRLKARVEGRMRIFEVGGMHISEVI